MRFSVLSLCAFLLPTISACTEAELNALCHGAEALIKAHPELFKKPTHPDYVHRDNCFAVSEKNWGFIKELNCLSNAHFGYAVDLLENQETVFRFHSGKEGLVNSKGVEVWNRLVEKLKILPQQAVARESTWREVLQEKGIVERHVLDEHLRNQIINRLV